MEGDRSVDLVVLVPGFLGFKEIGSFSYFSERVKAVLGPALSGLGPVCIEAVSTRATSSLDMRQTHLLKELQRLVGQAPGEVRWIHLIGHSTGGVDAQLLTCSHRVSGQAWGASAQKLREKLRAVVGVGSPHHGTCLTLSGVARFFASPWRFWDAPEVVWALYRLLPSIHWDEMVKGALRGAGAAPLSAARYVLEVLRSTELLYDLRPTSMASLRALVERGEPLKQAVCGSVVTMAGARTLQYEDADGSAQPRGPDRFFALLFELCSHGDGLCGPDEQDDLLEESCVRLQRMLTQDAQVIRHPHVELHPVNPGLNDGIVNSARQLVAPDGEVIAIAVADHLDVLGYFPRAAQPGQRAIRSGILHSGSGFGERQFVELYQAIAGWILEQL